MNQKTDIGIDEQSRIAIAEGLPRLLADATLDLKTHNFGWNVTGPQFNTPHLMFEQQYTDLATAVDEIAERGVFPAAEEAHDEPAADLLTQRTQIHEKTAWMLRSTIS